MDDFSDGDFTTNPAWTGNDAKFIISSGLLKLQAPTIAEKAYLTTTSNVIYNASWEFFVRMDFNPSSANYTRVYLVSNQSDLTLPLNGYYVMIGNTADEISLYRQGASTLSKIIDGVDGRVNLSTVSVKVKVTRDASGNWQLFSDVGSTGTYVSEGNVSDQTHTVSSYMGVHCTYTSTRSDKFWFDDFIATETPMPDLVPPALVSVQAMNQNSILVIFSEEIESSTAQTTTNFVLSNNLISSVIQQADGKSVIIELSTSLTNGLQYTLQISGIQDLDGNTMATIAHDFIYFVPLPVNNKDVIVSEFMADPTPTIGLPESEFVELLNRSTNPVDLEGWKLSDGTTTSILPKNILMPHSRLVITPTTSAASFTNAIGVSNFPSLNNTGDNIILKNLAGTTIDSISYTQAWYHSGEKKDGGWSLEIIDPENLCEEEENWTASENIQGGTPGSQNSVFASNPDLIGPIAELAIVISPIALEVSFNEKLDGNALISATTNPEIIFTSIKYSSTLKKIVLIASFPFLASTSYSLTLSNVFDCSGNELTNKTINFIFPEAASTNDILISEVLFNPKSGGVDFVEVYNTSSKHISLKKWELTNVDVNTFINPEKIENENLVIAPKSFLVFTTEPTVLKAHYPRTIEGVCIVNALPSMPDDEGSIALLDSLGGVMDYFLYNDNYHVIFLKDKEGVSLERVSLETPTNDANNWRSASQAENFATPGYKNSAASNGSSTSEGEVKVEPEIFSPQVAPTDFTKIIYRFTQGGQVVNATIFDQQGHVVKVLANNEVLGPEGFFRWDGDRDDGGRARAGYYVAWVEVFDSSGKVTTYRNRIVVTFQ